MGNAKSGCFANRRPAVIWLQVVPVADVLSTRTSSSSATDGTDPHALEVGAGERGPGRAMGPSTILVTSVETGLDSIGLMAVTDDRRGWSRRRCCRSRPTAGGDLTAALDRRPPRDRSAEQALSSAPSPRSTPCSATLDSGERELRLIVAQDALAQPAREFEALRSARTGLATVAA